MQNARLYTCTPRTLGPPTLYMIPFNIQYHEAIKFQSVCQREIFANDMPTNIDDDGFGDCWIWLIDVSHFHLDDFVF